MARLQRSWARVVVEHERGTQASGPHAHLHAQVKESWVPVPHAELAQESAHHLPSTRAPRHRQRLVLDVWSQAPRVHLYRGLWTKILMSDLRV